MLGNLVVRMSSG